MPWLKIVIPMYVSGKRSLQNRVLGCQPYGNSSKRRECCWIVVYLWHNCVLKLYVLRVWKLQIYIERISTPVLFWKLLVLCEIMLKEISPDWLNQWILFTCFSFGSRPNKSVIVYTCKTTDRTEQKVRQGKKKQNWLDEKWPWRTVPFHFICLWSLSPAINFMAQSLSQ